MKKLFLSGALALSFLIHPYTATSVIAEQKTTQQCIIKDGMYDNHNAFVDESQYSLDSVLESIELIVHEFKYLVNYKTLEGYEFSIEKDASTMGSGVVIEKKDGKAYILTNNHIIEGKIPSTVMEEIPPLSKNVKIEKLIDKIYVVKGSMYEQLIEAKTVASDKGLDTALLELEDSGNLKKFPYKIGNSDDLRHGDFIWAVGNPLGLIDYTLKGNVSQLYFNFNPDLFMIGSDIQPGYSGGAVIAIRDGEYELVGLVVATLIMPPSEGEMPDALGGYGIAIKINPAMKMVDNYFDSLKKKEKTSSY